MYNITVSVAASDRINFKKQKFARSDTRLARFRSPTGNSTKAIDHTHKMHSDKENGMLGLS